MIQLHIHRPAAGAAASLHSIQYCQLAEIMLYRQKYYENVRGLAYLETFVFQHGGYLWTEGQTWGTPPCGPKSPDSWSNKDDTGRKEGRRGVGFSCAEHVKSVRNATVHSAMADRGRYSDIMRQRRC